MLCHSQQPYNSLRKDLFSAPLTAPERPETNSLFTNESILTGSNTLSTHPSLTPFSYILVPSCIKTIHIKHFFFKKRHFWLKIKKLFLEFKYFCVYVLLQLEYTPVPLTKTCACCTQALHSQAFCSQALQCKLTVGVRGSISKK